MAEKVRTSGRHSKRGIFIVLLIAAVVVVSVAITVVSQWSSLRLLLDERAQLAEEYNDLKSELDSKNEYVDYIGSDAYYMEKAREILGWVRSGEIKYIFTTPDEAAPTAQP